MYAVNGKIIAQENKGSELLDYLLDAAQEMEHVENCFCYIVGMNNDQLESVYVYEVWKDKQAHEDSLQLPAVKKLIALAMPIIKDMVAYPSLVIHGGKANFIK